MIESDKWLQVKSKLQDYSGKIHGRKHKIMNTATIFGHLKTLYKTIGTRPVGSLPNRQAMEYIGKYLECLGYPVKYQLFSCNDWNVNQVSCRVSGQEFTLVVNPFSPSCALHAPVLPLQTIDDLRGANMTDKIAVLYGDLAGESLMPKKFPFFQSESHREIIGLFEEKKPGAIIFIAETDFPVPLIIDGDFSIPSGTMSGKDRTLLLKHPGEIMELSIKTESYPARAANVICKTPGEGKKILLCAHFDTKYYTPGALDNSSGVAALMVLADRLRRSAPKIPIEFVFFNGEECYNIPGEMAWLSSEEVSPETILFAVNIDGIGLKGHLSSIAYFSCPAEMESVLEETRSRYPGLVKADPWPQGDHMMFALKKIPTIACTTSAGFEEVERIIHTPSDTMDNLDIGRIMVTIDAIEALIRKISDMYVHC